MPRRTGAAICSCVGILILTICSCDSILVLTAPVRCCGVLVPMLRSVASCWSSNSTSTPLATDSCQLASIQTLLATDSQCAVTAVRQLVYRRSQLQIARIQTQLATDSQYTDGVLVPMLRSVYQLSVASCVCIRAICSQLRLYTSYLQLAASVYQLTNSYLQWDLLHQGDSGRVAYA